MALKRLLPSSVCTRSISTASAALIGADYEDGTSLTAFASEILIRNGSIDPSVGGGEQAMLEIAMVDLTNTSVVGGSSVAKNPVCVTFELLLTERQRV